MISKTNLQSIFLRQGCPSQCSKKQLVPVVLSLYTFPDDMADRNEQREAHTGKKHKLRGQLGENIRVKKQRLNHSI